MTETTTHAYVAEWMPASSIESCASFGEGFYRECRIPGTFEPERFMRFWHDLYRLGRGGIIGLYHAQVAPPRLVGGIGVLVHEDIYDGRWVAQEALWYIAAAHRSMEAATRLLQAFHQYAEQLCVAETRMSQFVNHERAPALAKWYERMGYHQVETAWVKSMEPTRVGGA